MALSAVGLHTFGLVVGTRGSKQTSEVENIAPYESAAQLLAQVCEQTGDDPECCRLELKSSSGWTALDDTGRTLESFGITRAGLVLELVMQEKEETQRRREAAIAAALRAALEAESATRVKSALQACANQEDFQLGKHRAQLWLTVSRDALPLLHIVEHAANCCGAAPEPEVRRMAVGVRSEKEQLFIRTAEGDEVAVATADQGQRSRWLLTLRECQGALSLRASDEIVHVLADAGCRTADHVASLSKVASQNPDAVPAGAEEMVAYLAASDLRSALGDHGHAVDEMSGASVLALLASGKTQADMIVPLSPETREVLAEEAAEALEDCLRLRFAHCQEPTTCAETAGNEWRSAVCSGSEMRNGGVHCAEFTLRTLGDGRHFDWGAMVGVVGPCFDPAAGDLVHKSADGWCFSCLSCNLSHGGGSNTWKGRPKYIPALEVGDVVVRSRAV